MSQDYPTVPPKTAENQKVQVNLLIINMLCLIQVQCTPALSPSAGERETRSGVDSEPPEVPQCTVLEVT